MWTWWRPCTAIGPRGSCWPPSVRPPLWSCKSTGCSPRATWPRATRRWRRSWWPPRLPTVKTWRCRAGACAARAACWAAVGPSRTCHAERPLCIHCAWVPPPPRTSHGSNRCGSATRRPVLATTRIVCVCIWLFSPLGVAIHLVAESGHVHHKRTCSLRVRACARVCMPVRACVCMRVCECVRMCACVCACVCGWLRLGCRLVTSRGAGTTVPFALTLVQLLCGEAAAVKVADGLVYRWPRS